VYLLPLGVRGDCAPGKNFQITHACRRVLAHFSDKVNALLPAFIPVNCGKVPNPFDLKPLVTEDAGRKQLDNIKPRKNYEIDRHL
jgi:hypothetical protein